ncbi:MAG: hypothetical protein EBR93_04760 [Bacteroidetes bacterium]|nr:hypothetical protein [Bacteroidota bacterium]
MTVWFDDPSVLIDPVRMLKFWPTSEQTPAERVNATSRFIIYATIVLYLIQRDTRLIGLAALVLAVLFVFYRNDVVDAFMNPDPVTVNGCSDCQQPTMDNPMGNVLLTDYIDQPNRNAACYYPSVAGKVKSFLDDTFMFDAGRSRSPLPSVQRRHAGRQFVTTPVSTIPGAQTEFAEFCYGKKFRPLCRSDQSVCDPNFRGAQLEAFAGLAPNGDKRSGMASF